MITYSEVLGMSMNYPKPFVNANKELVKKEFLTRSIEIAVTKQGAVLPLKKRCP